MLNFRLSDNYIPKKACVLGSTGSIGTQTLCVIRDLGLEVPLLSAGSNLDVLIPQILEFRPDTVCVRDEETAKKLSHALSTSGHRVPLILFREKDVSHAVMTADCDIIFHSVAGLAGISQAVAAAGSGKRVGMANKEAIISLGDWLTDLSDRSGGTIIPVDSEHSAVYRCMYGHPRSEVRKIVLTASGGPFYGKDREFLGSVTPELALRHPTWKMGRKITVDSATLMNKGFELIEASRLFGKGAGDIDVVVHRQSIVHSMIMFRDGTMLAQMGRPDMRDCIRYAATAPRTTELGAEPFDILEHGELTFGPVDSVNFPAVELARAALLAGGTVPCSLIAADEEAVEAFLRGRIGFTDITAYTEKTLERCENFGEATPDTVRQAESEARTICRELIGQAL